MRTGSKLRYTTLSLALVAASLSALMLDLDGAGNLASNAAEARDGGGRGGGRGDGGGRGGGGRGSAAAATADANADGQVTLDELTAQATANGKTEAEAAALFDRLDRNDDGVVDSSDRGHEGSGGGRGRLADADSNGDGQITQEELAAQLTADGKTDVDAATLFDKLDSNDDGVITSDDRPTR